MKRDRTSDEICNRITAKRQDVIVAFGGSTGFGFAPTPQGRLRYRLEKVHKADVVLTDEYMTSQKLDTTLTASQVAVGPAHTHPSMVNLDPISAELLVNSAALASHIPDEQFSDEDTDEEFPGLYVKKHKSK